MKLLNNKYGMLINFGPKGVFSESWMLGETINDRCIKI